MLNLHASQNARRVIAVQLFLVLTVALTYAQQPADDVIPFHQSVLPGPPLSPAEAIEKMEVPPGFTVELVASEPQLVNPVAMAIDERGRFWVTESFEYPRQEAGPGRDRVKILEDTDHDGRVDKVTIFAEGLNIPSGIALGHGGVWVANSPDILLLRDTDGDDRADTSEVVLSGFGRTDTHELPNSLTWGPDGWLYGLNGVFNYSRVVHQGKEHAFTCVLFRIHPRTREFQLFAEGTSNPWGVAFDSEGSAFVSACVIDHLWHVTESGYYHRQGGPYPPHTWKLESIVDHEHQMAAYCGLTYFDSEAYPAEYRQKLYMGNIHGCCVNVDELTRNGATYVGKPRPDFLTANDAWFMPVVQKTGPDGCLYILDWYDRYHCYQDANRDPEGIDRGRGRLYRVRYQETPRAAAFDLRSETNDELLARLQSSNIFFREQAQRLLAERAGADTRANLQRLALDSNMSRQARLHGLWALIGSGPLPVDTHRQLLQHDDPTFRGWGVRAAGDQSELDASLRDLVQNMTDDPSADVRLQVAIAARKLSGAAPSPLLCRVLAYGDTDPLIPHIVWQNLLPIWEESQANFVAFILNMPEPNDAVVRLLPHAVARILDSPTALDVLPKLLVKLTSEPSWDPEGECLAAVREALIEQAAWREQRSQLGETLLPVLRGKTLAGPARDERLQLAALLGDTEAQASLRQRLDLDQSADLGDRVSAYRVLAAAGDTRVIESADDLLARAAQFDEKLVTGVIESLQRLPDPRVAEVVLARYEKLPQPLQPRAVELLTQRIDWAKSLLAAIAANQISRDSLHINQVRRLQKSDDKQLSEQVYQLWGTIREGRNPQVEDSIRWIRRIVDDRPGDAGRGQEVYRKTCGQCHQIYGQGEQVGPDITRNGRASFDQLLSNVFDPNLVIGADYQARTVTTTDGRTLSGLLVEDSPARVVLKLQGGKVESVAREEIDELVVSPLSLMPEGWEKQLTEQELIDLMHFLTLDGPPGDSQANRLPGTPELRQ